MSSYAALHSRISIVKYADDVTIIIPAYKTLINDFSIVNNEIQHSEEWCSRNCMYVNRTKTKVLNISTVPISSVSRMTNVNTLKML